MRRIILILFLSLVIILIPLSTTFAQNPSTDLLTFEDRLKVLREERQRKLKDFKERRQELLQNRQNLQEKVATRQAELRQRVIIRIKLVFTKILERYNAALRRLDRISERIATRIDKLNQRGIDTSVAQKRLTEAESLGTAAAESIITAQAQVSALDENSANIKEIVQTTNAAIRNGKRALFNYHKGLVAAIRELKAAAALREGTNSAN